MKTQPVFIALSNQKGGVGKSSLTVALAACFHYLKDKRVLVVDCDYPQYSINAMRERDIKTLSKCDRYKVMLKKQSNNLTRKAFSIITSKPEDAIKEADAFLEKSSVPHDLVIVDLPGTVNLMGVFRTIFNMDYLLIPITPDRMTMQSSMSFATTINEYIKSHPDVPLKGAYLIWNRVDKRVSPEVFEFYKEIITQIDLDALSTVIPETARYGREMSVTGKDFFRSTLLAPCPKLLPGSMLIECTDEIADLIKL